MGFYFRQHQHQQAVLHALPLEREVGRDSNRRKELSTTLSRSQREEFHFNDATHGASVSIIPTEIVYSIIPSLSGLNEDINYLLLNSASGASNLNATLNQPDTEDTESKRH